MQKFTTCKVCCLRTSVFSKQGLLWAINLASKVNAIKLMQWVQNQLIQQRKLMQKINVILYNKQSMLFQNFSP